MPIVWLVILAVLCGGLLSGCAAEGASDGPSTHLQGEMGDFSFRPNYLSVLAGQQITLEVSYRGAIGHDFILLKKAVVLNGFFDPETQANDVLFRAALDPGGRANYTFPAPAVPGTAS